MQPEYYPHRYADIILNADYELKKEIEEVIRTIEFSDVEVRFGKRNLELITEGRKQAQGKQATINLMFREAFRAKAA